MSTHIHAVFIEGIPGSGKSTLARRLCENLQQQGLDSLWYLEEAHDHPVHPRPWPGPIVSHDFADACLNRWAVFVEKWARSNSIHVFDGSAFQSTVRFMMEMRLAGIEDYFRQFETILAPLNPCLVYLRPDDILRHSNSICALRGDEWTKKVSSYLAESAYSTHFYLTGREGMHSFWQAYAVLCDRLVGLADMPVRRFSIENEARDRALSDTLKLVALGTSNQFS